MNLIFPLIRVHFATLFPPKLGILNESVLI